MASMNISLPQQMRDWVEEQAASGRYANASDYMRDLIRRDQERRSAGEALRRLAEEAEAGGFVEDFDPAAFRKALMNRNA
ncbi:type II toxin-antitoxin system ParD family antitoxin [Frigidibacter oleivorans]|uniref:type II toxin-antitoxin system ParD family antitoxin n=1 Tax=Frigidibacter oleivorans TaxID=2487129 RepID=UPI000F8E6C10|nr:type II toxin-antitoxin system ParD family antitoxin [Frigidibacter oleivorans]